mmetsp:Transcript_9538/g.21245  ORF Transcript_9538/g.21245 Transcript_9538/m.21245 type:complete len:319 (+) Transcript_9538:72-1028(+)
MPRSWSSPVLGVRLTAPVADLLALDAGAYVESLLLLVRLHAHGLLRNLLHATHLCCRCETLEVLVRLAALSFKLRLEVGLKATEAILVVSLPDLSLPRLHDWRNLLGVIDGVLLPLGVSLHGHAPDLVHRVLDGVLVVVEVVRSDKELEALLEDSLGRRRLWHRLPHCGHDDPLWESLLQILEPLDTRASRAIAQVAEVELVVVLLALHPDLLAVRDNGIGAHIIGRVKEGILFPSQGRGDVMCQSGEMLRLGVKVIPLPILVRLQLGVREIGALATPVLNGRPLVADAQRAIAVAADETSWELLSDEKLPSRAAVLN